MALYSVPMIPQTTFWTFPTQVIVPVTAPILKPVNDVPLTRELLTRVLNDLSDRLYRSFRRQVRLVVHGGAVMVLHPSLKHRESTQDIDYIHRSFVSEYRALGFPDAEQRLHKCIAETALKYNLGADWMNDHADVALPLAFECVLTPPLPLSDSFSQQADDEIMFGSFFPSSLPFFFHFPRIHIVNKAVPTTPSSTPPHAPKTPTLKRSSARAGWRWSPCRGRGRWR
jgi:hypothetical protein